MVSRQDIKPHYILRSGLTPFRKVTQTSMERLFIHDISKTALRKEILLYIYLDGTEIKSIDSLHTVCRKRFSALHNQID